MKKNSFMRAAVGFSAVALLSLTACSSNAEAEAGESGKTYQVAVLASSSQNGYNQAIYQGVVEGAEGLGIKINAKILDGQFDANTQLSQLQNATTSDQYDGVIVVPQDGPALAAAFPLANEIPVVSVLNPIGQDINKMEPQVEGLTATVASSPSAGAAKQAAQVVDYCKEIDPCKVGIVIGLLNSPLDVARNNAYKEVLSTHGNIKIVGTVEGGYDRDQSLTAVSNLLQANKDINAILSNADQQTSGAQIALESAGIDPASIFLTGGGGTKDAIKAVKDGTWTSTYVNFPVSMGASAVEQLNNAWTQKDVQAVVDADTLGPVPAFSFKNDLDKVPSFTGEWNG